MKRRSIIQSLSGFWATVANAQITIGQPHTPAVILQNSTLVSYFVLTADGQTQFPFTNWTQIKGVYRNGLFQTPNWDYNLANGVLTFVIPTANGDTISIVS